MQFKICAVVNTLDRPRTVVKCLNSLIGQANLTELIVVDDGSRIPLKWVMHSNPSVPYKVLRNEHPMGCCQSRNQAVETISDATHVFFVDDDEVVQPDCLRILSDEREWRESKLAATGGAVIDMGVARYHQNLWRYLVPPMKINHKGQICDLSELWVESAMWYDADHLRGGNILLSLEAFRDVGGFSPEFKVGSFRGETDLCLKLREKGYKLRFNPTARVLHQKYGHGGMRTTGQKMEHYDRLWREKWQPKKFLGDMRTYPPKPAVIVRRR